MPAVIAPVIAIGAALFEGAAAVGAGVAAAAAGLSGSTLLGIAATAALVGVEYLTRPSGSNSQPAAPQQGPAPVPARKTIRQSDVPRCFIFGRTKMAGAYFMYESDGYFGSAGNSGVTIYQGIYICDGPIDGFDAFICDDESAPVVASTSSGAVTDGTADSSYYVFSSGMKRGNYQSGSNTLSGFYAVAFEPVNATVAGRYSQLYNKTSGSFSSGLLSGVWPNTCIGQGITCVYTWACTYWLSVASSNQGKRPSAFPMGFPEWAFCVRGARVYDPRDAAQALINPTTGVWDIYNSTWKWSENPALIAAHFISWLISQNLTAIQGVDWSSIAIAANDCDALAPATIRNIAGGAAGAASEPFARISGVYYLNTPPREFLSQIMAACDGTYSVDQNGNFTMWIGKWEDPAVTFTESDVSSFTEEFLASATEAVNEVHSTYIEPMNSYQRYEAPTWRDTDSIASVGLRLTSVKYDLVPSFNQAYRLSQRYARRINGKRKLTVTLGPRGMLAFKQRVVGLYLPNFGIEQSTWRVEALAPQDNLTSWTATLREITADVFSDSPAPRDPSTMLKIVGIAASATAPSNFLLSAYAGSSVGTAYVVASMNQHTNAPDNSLPSIVTADVIQEQTLQFEAAYSTDGGSTYATMTTYLSNYIMRSPDLATGQTVYVKVRYMNADGSYSSYSSPKTIAI